MATTDPIPTHAADDSRWEGVERPYDTGAVERLRGSLPVEHTLARHGAEKLWTLLHERDYVAALGELQEREFASEDDGFTAVQHQQEVGAGYFEEVAMAITGGESETTALSGSTEESQFQS